MNLEALNEKLDRAHVSQRKGSGSMMLSYIEGHHAIREANRIFGPLNWEMTCENYRVVQQEEKEGKYGKLWYVAYTAECEITVSDSAVGTTRKDIGFGQGQDADLGKAHESAIKEAATDAMKRAFRTFGDPFGLALYDKAQANVEDKPDPKPKPEPKPGQHSGDECRAFLESLEGFERTWTATYAQQRKVDDTLLPLFTLTYDAQKSGKVKTLKDLIEFAGLAEAK